MTKILIADDHALLRNGLKRIISAETDMEVLWEAKNSSEVMDLVKKENIDLLILDINMPGRSGLDILQDIKLLRPDMPILILSINPEDQFARRCYSAGASGYMNKDIEPEEFILAIRKLAGGKKYFSADFMEILLNEVDNKKSKSPQDMLSSREFEVLRLIAQRKKHAEIADILSLSIKTVNTYRARILEKLNLKSTEELTEYAKKNFL